MNTNNLDGLLECEDCGKVCNGIQGIRGHRRSCPGREQVVPNRLREPQEPVVEPVVRAPNQQISLGSRLNVEGVNVMLLVHEQLRALLDQLRESLPIRRLSDSNYDRERSWPTYQDWFELGRNVVRLKMAIERVIQQGHVSRHEPWILYQLAIKCRDQSVSWRRDEAVHTWKQRASEKQGEGNEPKVSDLEEVLLDFGVPQLEAEWDNVIRGLRWLTAHTRATL